MSGFLSHAGAPVSQRQPQGQKSPERGTWNGIRSPWSTGKMNEASYDAATALVPKTYVTQGRDARRTHEKHIQMLIQQVQCWE